MEDHPTELDDSNFFGKTMDESPLCIDVNWCGGTYPALVSVRIKRGMVAVWCGNPERAVNCRWETASGCAVFAIFTKSLEGRKKSKAKNNFFPPDFGAPTSAHSACPPNGDLSPNQSAVWG